MASRLFRARLAIPAQWQLFEQRPTPEPTRRIAETLNTIAMWLATLLSVGLLASSQASRHEQASPTDSAISASLKARGLQVANWMKPERVTGDFDGDGKADVALLVSSVKTKKRGVLLVHGGRTRSTLAGAGVAFGNGGDDFEWANHWQVVKRKGKPDALLVEREESGGGLIEFASGKYRWRQQGD